MDNIDEILKFRREFHKCAEVGWLEFETTIKIIEYLNEWNIKTIYGKKVHSFRMGLPTEAQKEKHKKCVIKRNPQLNHKKYKEIFEGYTGVIGVLDTKRQGNNTILRFDIDANNVVETDEEKHIPNKEDFASYNYGMMHACGHDAHIAIGLMVAKEISKLKNELTGKIYFIFQPAEEGVRGASSIIDSEIGEEIFKKADYFISSHIGFSGKDNEIVCCTEGFLGTTKLDIEFYGKASHAGACPENGRNALLGASNCILGLYSLTQFSAGISRINVGTLMAGTARNVVPSIAILEIETRSDEEEINIALVNRVKDIVKGSANMYGLDYKIKKQGMTSAYKIGNRKFGYEIYDCLSNLNLSLIKVSNFGASEDATSMMRKVEENGGQAIYMIIGTNRADEHHNEHFDINEKNLINGFNVYMSILKKLNNPVESTNIRG